MIPFFVSLRRLALVSSVAIAASAVPRIALARTPVASVAGPAAEDLIAGARLLDARAAALESRATSKREHARRLIDRARDLREDATRDADRAASLRARAEEDEVTSTQLFADASQELNEARSIRARASALRARAKVLASAPSAKERGRLDVDSRGACELEIDGVPRGSAPVLGIELRPGGHAVACTAEGFPKRTRLVTIEPGQAARVTFEDAPHPIDPFGF